MDFILLGLLHEKDLCVAQLCEEKMRIIIDLMVIHVYYFLLVISEKFFFALSLLQK